MQDSRETRGSASKLAHSAALGLGEVTGAGSPGDALCRDSHVALGVRASERSELKRSRGLVVIVIA